MRLVFFLNGRSINAPISCYEKFILPGQIIIGIYRYKELNIYMSFGFKVD